MNMEVRSTTARGPQGSALSARILVASCLCGAAFMLAGCGRSVYDPKLLREAAALGEEQRWDEARPLVKAHLLDHPDDAIAHYYYGLSFLHLARPQLALAEGELLTAQALLSPESSPTEAAANMEYFTFKGVLHQKTALVYMRAFREAMHRDVPFEYAQDLLVKAAAQVDLGLKSDPKSHALKEYRDFLQETLKGTTLEIPEIMTRAAGQGSPI